MTSRIFFQIVNLLFLVLALPAISLPKYDRLTLPIPRHLDEGDQYIAHELLKLEVYQDSEDPNLFYFVPPFHLRQFTRGAAGMMLNSEAIKAFAGAKKELEKRSNFDHDLITELRTRVNEDEVKVQIAEEKLEEAIEQGNVEIIGVRRDALARRTQALNRSLMLLSESEDAIRGGGSLLSPGMSRGFFERALLYLAGVGVTTYYSGAEDPDVLTKGINKILDDISDDYGGYLSVNAYAGFTRAQLDALTTYREKYLPDIRVSLMPIESLTFFPLTEMQFDDNRAVQTKKMFLQVKGAGDYFGTTVVLDTSIMGSLGLAEHLAPFILPVGIRAILRQKLEPAEAELVCDFSNGFNINGRADIRDGLIIYDNDIINTMSASDDNRGSCFINYISGDPNSARFDGLRNLEAQYEALRLRRTYLSRIEKEAYFNGVLQDIQNNRRPEELHYTYALQSLAGNGWESLVIQGLARAADFHWHTNIQNVQNISTVKFRKRISIKGHQTVYKDFPATLCLVFNRVLGAYDRCTEQEDNEAKNVAQSMEDASDSEPCRGISDPFECGRRRDEFGYTPRQNLPLSDDDMVGNI